jgi:hypothetical protein
MEKGPCAGKTAGLGRAVSQLAAGLSGTAALKGYTMKRIWILWLVAVMTPLPVAGAPQPDLWDRWQTHDQASVATIDHSAWGRFLDRYLVAKHPSGIHRVRYAAVTREDRKALHDYLDQLQRAAVSGLNRPEQKAYWINLYNALTVKIILDHYPVKSIRDIDISPGWFKDGPWDARLLTIEGEKLSLNDIEHRILRPIWQDNRVHYAVNCASLGCPNLQPQPFRADNLEDLLEQAARAYINHPRGLRIGADQVTLSAIFDWFQVDFGGSEQGVREHLRRYAEPPAAQSLKEAKGGFSYSYDWRLNE